MIDTEQETEKQKEILEEVISSNCELEKPEGIEKT